MFRALSAFVRHFLRVEYLHLLKVPSASSLLKSVDISDIAYLISQLSLSLIHESFR